MQRLTRMLYMEGGLERCYERSFTARVLEAKPDHVILDQTLFYPLGGGQEWDTGALRTADGREGSAFEPWARPLVRGWYRQRLGRVEIEETPERAILRPEGGQ